jgi:hypothetical protein
MEFHFVACGRKQRWRYASRRTPRHAQRSIAPLILKRLPFELLLTLRIVAEAALSAAATDVYFYHHLVPHLGFEPFDNCVVLLNDCP